MSHVEASAEPRGEREALEHLSFVRGPGERRAALLALLLTPGSQREQAAWKEATADVVQAAQIAADVALLGAATRLPVFDALLERSRSAPLAERQGLVETARRVMGADGQVSPLDRLRWLVLRQRLGDAPLAPPGTAVAPDGSELAQADAVEFAVLTAFLARIVPVDAGGSRIAHAGRLWHERVLAPWAALLNPLGGAASMCKAPDGEQMLRALRRMQAQSWMHRPVLVQAWIGAIEEDPGVASLEPDACDALRLAATLLDAPLPPSLAARYRDTGWS